MLMASRAVVAAAAIMRTLGVLVISLVRVWFDVASCTGRSSNAISVQYSDTDFAKPSMAIGALHSCIVGNVVTRLATQRGQPGERGIVAFITFSPVERDMPTWRSYCEGSVVAAGASRARVVLEPGWQPACVAMAGVTLKLTFERT